MFSLGLAFTIAGLIMTFSVVRGAETSDESVATSPAPTDGLHCMSCYNCKIFEMTSHSVKCDPSYTHCLVGYVTKMASEKMSVWFLLNGQVQSIEFSWGFVGPNVGDGLHLRLK